MKPVPSRPAPAKRALLLEVGGSHDELLYSQLRFLKQGSYHTTLACDPALQARLWLPAGLADAYYICGSTAGGSANAAALWKLRRYILAQGITQVIFNTAQNEAVRNLCLMPFPRQVRFSGTLHNLKKLKGSFSQRLISRRLKGYLVLADYLKDHARLLMPHGTFETYYPMYFPEVPPLEEALPEGTYRIAIPGAVEYSRRDYEGIARALASLHPRPPIQFLLLGNAFHPQGQGRQLLQLLKELNVEAHFRVWDGYLPTEEFHRYIRSCDAVMAAVHPACADYDDYVRWQISGTWNLAFGYGKPLLIEAGFKAFPDFQDVGAIAYTVEELPQLLAQLPRRLAALREKFLFAGPRWDFETQARRYLAFLER